MGVGPSALARALFPSDATAYARALDAYPAVLAAFGREKSEAKRATHDGGARLLALDAFAHDALPARIAARTPPHVVVEELGELVSWKMKRGTFRPRNLRLALENPPAAVIAATTSGLAEARAFLDGDSDAERRAIAAIATLAGIGPATASAVLQAFDPAFPFLDDTVALALPQHAAASAIDFTLPVYLDYAATLRARAAALSTPTRTFTAKDLTRALWATAQLV